MFGLFANHIFLNAIEATPQNSFPILTCLFCGNDQTKMFQMFLRKNNKWKDLFLYYLTFLNLRYTNHSNNKEQYIYTVLFIKYDSSYKHSSRKVENGYQGFLFFQYIMSGYDSFSRHVCDITFIISTQPKCLF